MANMQEIKLNLVISAENLANSALSELRSTLESLSGFASRAFENLALAGNEAVRSLENDFRGLNRVIQESLQSAASHSFEPLAIAGEKAVNSIKKEFDSLRTTIEKDMRQAAEEAARAFKVTIPSGGGIPLEGGGKGIRGLLGIEGQMNTLYAGMTFGAAALPIVDTIKEAIKAYADFDQAVAAVNTMLQLNSQGVQNLRQQLIALSHEVPQGPKELAEGLYSIVGAGVKASDALKVLKVAAEAAAAGQTDMDTATRALITVMDSYGLKASSIKHISDVLFAANQAGAMTFRDLAASIGTVAGPAANAGVSFEEVAAATAALTNTGLSAQRATEGLRALIIGIQNPTKGAQKEAKQLGIEWDAAALKAHGLAGMIQLAMQATHGNTEELKKLIPNIAAYTAAVNLGGKGAQSFKEAMDLVSHSAGATDRAMQAIKQSAQYNIQQFEKTWEDVKISFAQNILPTITSVLQVVQHLMEKFNSLSPSTQRIISLSVLAAGAFLTLGSAMFMTISAIGSVYTGILELRKALQGLNLAEKFAQVSGAIRNVINVARTLPIIGNLIRLAFGPWGLVIAAVVAGVALIITHWKQIAQWAKQTFGISLPTNFKEFQALWNTVWNSIQQVFSTVWNVIKKIFSDIWNYIRPSIIQGLREIQRFWNTVWPYIQQVFQTRWHLIQSLLSTGLNFILSHWRNIWSMIKDVFKTVWDAIVGIVSITWHTLSGIIRVGLDILSGHWRKAWYDMKSMLSNILHDIASMISSFISHAMDWGLNLVKMLADGIMSGVHWVENAASYVASRIAAFLGFHSPAKEGPASDADKWMPNMMQMHAQGIMNNIPVVESAAISAAGTIRRAMHHPAHHTSHTAHHVSHHTTHHHQTHHSHPHSSPSPAISTSSDMNRYFQRLKDTIVEAIQETFKSLKDTIVEALQSAGGSGGLAPAYAGGYTGSGSSEPALIIEGPSQDVVRRVAQAVQQTRRITEIDPWAKPMFNSYDQIPGHSTRIPTVGYWALIPGHTSHHHYNIHIHVEGRSHRTDRELAEHVVSLITRHIKTHR